MRTNQVKEKLNRGEPSLGAWLSLPSVPSARIMARLGFDWLVVDMEHTAHNPVLMADMVATRAAGASQLQVAYEQTTAHDMVIADSTGTTVAKSSLVQPGNTDTFTVNNLKAGTSYVFYCDLPGHRASGMEGTLTVS